MKKTTRDRLSSGLPWVGVVLILTMFALSLARVMRVRDGADGRVVVRIAHWQLEAGIRQGIDAAARAYEAMHPDVRIEQILVPERVYATWLTTRLVGGTAPEIIELTPNYESARVAAYFLPLGTEVDEPNPYNAGSELAGVAWRSTFADGLASAYHEELADYYGAGPFTGSRCLYFNRRLLRELSGSEEAPADYRELEALLVKLAERNERLGTKTLGFAMHRSSALALFNDLFAAQMQRLGTEIGGGTGLPARREEFYLARLRGDWDLDRPEMRATLDNLRALSTVFPPGFTQLGREDAMLAFTQGRALFFYSGTWDATNLAAQADFPVGVTRPITPGPEHDRFGAGVLGGLASEDASGSPAFSVTRDAPNAERAIDFLRFLTSVRGNTIFSEASGWLPSVVGVPGPEGLAGLVTKAGGYPRGPSILGGADTNLVFSRHLPTLIGPGGGVEKFSQAFGDESREAMRSDLERSVRGALAVVRRDDLGIAAGRVLAMRGESGVFARRAEAQNEREAWVIHLDAELKRTR